MFQRSQIKLLKERLSEPRKFIQVISGPRQVGKTRLVEQYLETTEIPYHYASADAAGLIGPAWIHQQWETARLKMSAGNHAVFLLVLDEIQKIENWSEIIKARWDSDTFNKIQLKLVLLGSSSLLIQKGLTESMAGRFELINLTHWSMEEMESAFGFSAEEFAWFGGYPGGALLCKDEARWKDYITNSLIETSITKDILLVTRIHKPALLRNLFYLGCQYSGQILSYNKMIGQLHDAGNTTTLADYLQILGSAGLLTGLEKFSGSRIMKRSSSPKFQVLNTALISAQNSMKLADAVSDLTYWGRVIESAIGAHLVNNAQTGHYEINYWREGNMEVDFILQKNYKTIAIEVKSGFTNKAPGIRSFHITYPEARMILVGQQGIPWQEFLKINPEELF
jgi:uncharacterized protein